MYTRMSCVPRVAVIRQMDAQGHESILRVRDRIGSRTESSAHDFGGNVDYFDPSAEWPEQIGKLAGDIFAALVVLSVVILVAHNVLA